MSQPPLQSKAVAVLDWNKMICYCSMELVHWVPPFWRIARQMCDHIIVADIMDDKLEEAKAAGAKYTINTAKENFLEKVLEYTPWAWCHCVH